MYAIIFSIYALLYQSVQLIIIIIINKLILYSLALMDRGLYRRTWEGRGGYGPVGPLSKLQSTILSKTCQIHFINKK